MVYKGQEIKVSFHLKVPATCTGAELTDWLRFELNENGELKDSPISDKCLEAEFFTVDWRRV